MQCICSVHYILDKKLTAKLHDLNIQEDKQEIVISDIFGKQIAMQQIEGLLDNESTEEFEKGFEVLAKNGITWGLKMDLCTNLQSGIIYTKVLL